MPKAPSSVRRPAPAVPSHPARLVIEDVRPAVDDGRHPAKRVVGDAVTVEATVYRDGHDLLSGRVLFRGPGERRWQRAPMVYDVNFDRLQGSFSVDRVGRWEFTVEAWSDRHGSWAAGVAKKLAASADIADDVDTGAALLEEAARAAKGRDKATLSAAAGALRRGADPPGERLRAVLDGGTVDLARACLPPHDLTQHPTPLPLWVDRPAAGFGAWYEMFPRSQGTVPGRHGTFADAARRLPQLADLGFDVIYLPPIHPIARVKRKGPNNTLEAGPGDPGSPWAIGAAAGGHTAVEPALGTLDDFDRLVEGARRLGMEIALDYALQCSPEHPWVREHPDWFFVRPDGTIRHAENPPKKYEDIYPLNFWCADYPALWAACLEVLRFWIGHGVTVFRVDNPHTKPFAFWEWVIGEVRRTHPETVFLSEAFTRPARMKGLAKLGFTQSYTYFTWRNTGRELTDYLTELTGTEMVEYFRPNFFANTPDILHEYLQHGGRPAFLVRLVLAGTLSPLYGIYSGYELCENRPLRTGSEEYLDSEKYQVRVRNWDAPDNITEDVARLNRIRRDNPALRQLANLSFHPSENEQILFYAKQVPGNALLIAVNLDPHHAQETMVHAPLELLGIPPDAPYALEDLLTGVRYTWRGSRNFVRLEPTRQVAHIFRVERT